MPTLMRLSIAGAIVLATLIPHPSSAYAAPQTQSAIVPGQYIVVFKPSTSRMAAQSVTTAMAQAYGADVIHEYSAALNGFAAMLSDPAVEALKADPNVSSVEPDQIITYRAEWFSTDATDTTQTGATWGIDRVDQRDLPLNTQYIYSETGSGVNVYVIDTGIRITHNEFAGRAVSGFTAVNDGNGTNDCAGHGTHVAGTIGGATFGVAKQVKLYAVRVLACDGYGTTSGVIAGIDWVTANHVKPAVANMSLGGSPSTALDTAVKNSISAGVTYAVAAGNDYAKNACSYSPARVVEAITVSATTRTDYRASYSNIGTCLDLFAPGSEITSAWIDSDSAAATISGTSMATPHVAGAAAKYLQTNPAATPATVRDALVNAATLNKVKSAGTGSANRLLYSALAAIAPPTDNDGGPINIGESRTGTISPAYDTDDFSFDGLAGQIVLITQNKTATSTLDSFVELYRPDGSLLGSNDDSGGNNNARLQSTLPVNGKYRIRAKAYRTSTGAYTLSLSLVINGDADDFRWIAFGQTLSGTLSTASDRDTHYVSVAQGRTLRLRMNKVTSTLDSYLELYNPNGVRVSYNDDGGGNNNSLLSYVVPSTGVYRIVARSYYLRTSGQYQLVLEDVPLVNLAQGKPAVASSTEFVGAEPWLATDADLSTRWSSRNGDDQWWYVDLGSSQLFDQAVINWESGFARNYGVYVSDGAASAWRNVFWTNEGDGGVDVINFEAESARYVMFYGAKRGAASAFSFYGLSVFNTGLGSSQVLSAEGANDDPTKPPDTQPPAPPESPAEGDKDPQLTGEGEDGQENAPRADAASVVSPTVAITVELPVAIILKADANAIEEKEDDTLHLVGEASANAIHGRSVMTYEWSSHRDGILSANITATVPISQLVTGPHIITFRVQDDQGYWSQPSDAVWVNSPASFVYVPAVVK